MYCIKCGVRLSDTEKQCPLCGTVVYHPELEQPEVPPLYPRDRNLAPKPNKLVRQMLITILFLMPMLITLLCDLRISHTVTWSGYVIGSLVLVYVVACLPGWFRNPNPVIFVPCGFVAAGGYLLYISLATEGGWFLSFGFPVVGFLGLVVTAAVALLRYLRRGRAFVYGGALILVGAFMPLMEYLMILTFHHGLTGWSVYPCVPLVLLGGFLIFLGACRRARESVERKFFI